MALKVSETQVVSDSSVVANTPNITATGTITATTFVGNGSLLTGLSTGLVSTTQQNVTATTSTTTLDTAAGGLINLTLSANTTVTLTNTTAVNQIYIRMLGAGFNVSWPLGVNWNNNYQPDTFNHNYNVVSLYTRDTGTTWNGWIEVASLDYNYAQANTLVFTTPGPTVSGTLESGRLYYTGMGAGPPNDPAVYVVSGDGGGVYRSSPVAVGSGTDWVDARFLGPSPYVSAVAAIKSNGTLWVWGKSPSHGLSNTAFADISISSPVQLGTDTDWYRFGGTNGQAVLKKDGTAWVIGQGGYDNHAAWGGQGRQRSIPTQLFSLSTEWKNFVIGGNSVRPWAGGVKADGSLWLWGSNQSLGLIDQSTDRDFIVSSPIQIGVERDWAEIQYGGDGQFWIGIKEDGRAFFWGRNDEGCVGDGRTPASISSPVLIGGTNGGIVRWKQMQAGPYGWCGIKVDGTLWMAGRGNGKAGQGRGGSQSSMVQIATGTWKCCGYFAAGNDGFIAAIKTDGTLWVVGNNVYGGLGVGSALSHLSVMTQVGAASDWKSLMTGNGATYVANGWIAIRGS